MRNLNILAAILVAIGLAGGETIRRSGTEFYLPFFVDDYIMAAVLIIGAWVAYRSKFADLSFLLLAWAYTCGQLYLSFFVNLQRYMANSENPGISSPIWVTLIFVAFFVSIIGTLGTLRQTRSPKLKSSNLSLHTGATGAGEL